MRPLLLAARLLLVAFIAAVCLGHAVSGGFSHDENQFVAAGQLLADHGLLPYLDYPYTHAPYVAAVYGLSAALSDYDFLAARLFNAAAWFASVLVILLAFRSARQRLTGWLALLWEFTIAYLLLQNSILDHVFGNALNHSFATAFSLLALTITVGFRPADGQSRWRPFAAGAFLVVAALVRLNYASLIPILALVFVLNDLTGSRLRRPSNIAAFGGGILLGALPALALFITAPAGAIYANVVYTRLNPVYYSELLYRVNMTLVQKLLDFATYLLHTPVDLIAYLVTVYILVRAVIGFARTRAPAALDILAVSASAITLAATAFAPTPTQPQYFLAPIPFLYLGVLLAGAQLSPSGRLALPLLAVGLLFLLQSTPAAGNPLEGLRILAKPSEWVPVREHDYTSQLRRYVAGGRILTLMPMLPLEAKYAVYSFTATGPFSWRTSLLLTAARRETYGVTSPAELPALLQRSPPAAILTGFESTNAGFSRNDDGGLETPFIDYAQQNGFRPIPLPSSFLEQNITLWVPPP
jgi:hypothetical protein